MVETASIQVMIIHLMSYKIILLCGVAIVVTSGVVSDGEVVAMLL